MKKMKITDFVLLLAEKDTKVRIEVKKCFLNSYKPYVAYVINGQVVVPDGYVMVDMSNISTKIILAN